MEDTHSPLDRPEVTRRMRTLCSNCLWLENSFEQCRTIRTGFNCTKYQLKEEINQKRSADPSLNNPFGWLGKKGPSGENQAEGDIPPTLEEKTN